MNVEYAFLLDRANAATTAPTPHSELDVSRPDPLPQRVARMNPESTLQHAPGACSRRRDSKWSQLSSTRVQPAAGACGRISFPRACAHLRYTRWSLSQLIQAHGPSQHAWARESRDGKPRRPRDVSTRPAPLQVPSKCLARNDGHDEGAAVTPNPSRCEAHLHPQICSSVGGVTCGGAHRCGGYMLNPQGLANLPSPLGPMSVQLKSRACTT